jgi:hypothetical protein
VVLDAICYMKLAIDAKAAVASGGSTHESAANTDSRR